MSQVGVIHPDAFVDGSSSVYEARTEIQSFLVNSDTDIAVGDWVALDLSATGEAIANTVAPAGLVTVVGNPLVVGVALDANTSNTDGNVIRVITAGYCAVAKVTASIAAGIAVAVIETDATGEAATDALACPIAGVVLATDSGATGFAPVWVYKQF